MRLIFYIFFISQFLNFLGVFAEKVEEDDFELNSVEWEKVEEKKTKPLKEIIWKSYKNDEFYFGKKNNKVQELIELTHQTGKDFLNPRKIRFFPLLKLNLFYLLIIFFKKKIFKLQ